MPRKVKSSLVDHHFPRFYACYLLKSIRTPRATATYIGSTPSPPRRIRQHNGEITQGAWKTKHNRPWIMQMIVYGFPSKLTALQFEWAWQHPHISRHLRGEDGKAVFQMNSKSRYLKTNVSIARSMLCSHPYNTWPLHVKLFTSEAERIWNDASRGIGDLALPRGFSCTVELEGVDGKSGQTGSGRTGPIDVNDTMFTSEHLRKWTTMLASSRPLQCSICNDTLDRRHLDPMTMALCPSTDCTGVSHISCLCADFLEQDRTEHSTPRKLAMIPRGGQCRSCRTYVLWGDVIRGCYRRRGDDAPDPEDSDGGLDDEEGQSLDDVEHIPPPTRHRNSKATSRGVHRQRLTGAAPRKRQAAGAGQVSSEGEFFDLNKVSGDSEEDSSDEPPLVGASLQRTSKTYGNPPLKARTTMERSGAIAESCSRERKSALPTRSDTARPHAVHNPKAPRIARRNAKVPLAESTAEGHPEQRPTTKIVADPRPTQTVPQMATDDRRPPSGLPRRPAPRAKALPAYVEISDSPDSDLEEAAFKGRYKSSEALLSLYRRSPDYSPSRPGSPHGRLSRALSTLSISSGSELPDMSHLLRELGGKKKREDDEDVIVVSD